MLGGFGSHSSNGLTNCLSVCTAWKSVLYIHSATSPASYFWGKVGVDVSDSVTQVFITFQVQVDACCLCFFCFIYFFSPCLAPYQMFPLNLGASHQTRRGVSCQLFNAYRSADTCWTFRPYSFFFLLSQSFISHVFILFLSLFLPCEVTSKRGQSHAHSH